MWIRVIGGGPGKERVTIFLHRCPCGPASALAVHPPKPLGATYFTLPRMKLKSLLPALAVGLLVPGCSLFGSEPTVDQVFFIGTRVPADFLTTGAFELVATPLDEDGEAILDNDVSVEVEVLNVSELEAATSYDGANEVSGKPLAVALVLDGSGSMSSTDPNRLRVSGAQAFVERLSVTPGLDWEATVYTYSSFATREIEYSSSVEMLFDAIETVRASGGTETYRTLLGVLADGETERPASGFDPAIVLLSDGFPNSTIERPTVCSEATRLRVPIYAIGLGPASDISDDSDPAAVEEMREVARCTNSVYAGISESDPTAIRRIYESLATATSRGSVNYQVQLSGEGLGLLSPGDRLSFRLTVESGGGTATELFEIAVPNPFAAKAGGGPVENS